MARAWHIEYTHSAADKKQAPVSRTTAHGAAVFRRVNQERRSRENWVNQKRRALAYSGGSAKNSGQSTKKCSRHRGKTAPYFEVRGLLLGRVPAIQPKVASEGNIHTPPQKKKQGAILRAPTSGAAVFQLPNLKRGDQKIYKRTAEKKPKVFFFRGPRPVAGPYSVETTASGARVKYLHPPTGKKPWAHF